MSEAVIEENLKQFLLVLAVSLSVATLPQIFSWFRRIPYTLLLVIVGLGLALVDVRLLNLSPGLILSIFLPPLLFESRLELALVGLEARFGTHLPLRRSWGSRFNCWGDFWVEPTGWNFPDNGFADWSQSICY